MKTEYKVFIGIALAAIGVYLLVSVLSFSKYKEENKAYKLLVERMTIDSIASAAIIAGSEHREDSLLERTSVLEKRNWRYKRQKDELERKITDPPSINLDAIPDSNKYYVADSLLTKLKHSLDGLDTIIENDRDSD